MDIIILVIGIYYICQEAKRKGLNVLQWRLRLFGSCLGLDTLISGFSFYFLHKSYIVAAVSGLLGILLGGMIIFQWLYKTKTGNVSDGAAGEQE